MEKSCHGANCAKKPAGVARKEDIPFIKCQVCEKFASHLYHQVQAKQTEISPKNVILFSGFIIEFFNDWGHLYFVEESNFIILVHLHTIVPLSCGTVSSVFCHACTNIFEFVLDLVAKYLVTQWILADVKPANLPTASILPYQGDRTPREPFIAKSSKEAEMDKLLKSMEGMPGAPSMKMYSREDLMNMKNMGDEDAEDEDEDEEPDFPSKLGKVLGEKDGKNYDWKQRIINGPKESRMQARN
ncbi:uncharacterized protein LOC111385740 [Olea europaea var. sylvestris]|uniref:uncharacterized protein LOC111385740 n=1 Tax=Olea europaea var. sylvestris TaxID=158386 RepID=UPI000C1CEC54|nr:uncharacterized protein LOC111385740 [Olea europaea var. sylvestris]